MKQTTNFERITKNPETLAKEIYRICVIYRTKDYINCIIDACQATDDIEYNKTSLTQITNWLKQ